MKKPESFIYNFKWVGIMLLVMGIFFMGIAVVIQLIPIDYQDIYHYQNGVQQVSTPGTLRTFRLIFLLTFGLIGLILAMIAVIIFGRMRGAKKREQILKQEGTKVVATLTGYCASSVLVNGRRINRLQCAYTDFMGDTFIFKSRMLRMDPAHFLKNNEIAVYYERNNMKNYFVDVDGSAGIGTRLFEL